MLLAAAGLLLAVGARSDQDPVFRVDVKLVRVSATVKDATGKPVSGLKREDFEIRDNGALQQIAVFELHSALPLSVAILLDASGSTAKELRYEQEALSRFTRAFLESGNPADAAALFIFNWEVRQMTRFTRKAGAIEQALKKVKPEAGTSLYDAIYLAAGELEQRQGRRVMVAITDGGDTTSAKTFHEALKALHDADAIFYPILVMPVTNDPGRNIGGENALTQLAQTTGGRMFVPEDLNHLDAAFQEILRELRTQYVLGFYPHQVPLTANPFHRLEVRVKRPNLHVSARTGYYGDFDPNARQSPKPNTQ